MRKSNPETKLFLIQVRKEDKQKEELLAFNGDLSTSHDQHFHLRCQISDTEQHTMSLQKLCSNIDKSIFKFKSRDQKAEYKSEALFLVEQLQNELEARVSTSAEEERRLQVRLHAAENELEAVTARVSTSAEEEHRLQVRLHAAENELEAITARVSTSAEEERRLQVR